METRSFAQAIEELLAQIEASFARIERLEAPDTELHNLRAGVMAVLEMVEQDETILLAVDGFYQAVTHYVEDLDREVIITGDGDLHVPSERLTAARTALAAFREEIEGAEPSRQATEKGFR